ncbi:hypothetical protein Mapa_004793 [Marchantia paleacea]|nr:hypothetical protein Mapa_004793 [Marchantia paleacea]
MNRSCFLSQSKLSGYSCGNLYLISCSSDFASATPRRAVKTTIVQNPKATAMLPLVLTLVIVPIPTITFATPNFQLLRDGCLNQSRRTW